MTSEQIKKLAAAGLAVEQIAVVAEVMEKHSSIFRGDSAGSYHIENGRWVCDSPPVAADGTVLEPALGARKGFFMRDGLLMHDLVHRERPEGRIETKVQHGETTDGTKFINCPNFGMVDIPAVIARDCLTGQLIYSDGKVRGPTYAELDEGDSYP